MITYEAQLPYDRPNLSKAYLQGEADAKWMPLRSEKFYQNHGIELMRLQKVTNVDVTKKLIQEVIVKSITKGLNSMEILIA